MSLTLLFFAALALIAGRWLLQQGLMSKPWLEKGSLGDAPGPEGLPFPAAKVGLWTFLAVAGSLFALLIGAYSMQMTMPEMQNESWRIPTPALLWFNTGALVLSSVALHRAQGSARRGLMGGMKIGLLAACILTLTFLQGQLLVWRQLWLDGHFLAGDPASSFFYLITAVHGLHVAGGLVAMGIVGANMRHDVEFGRLRLSLDLCATYWHFLLLVWLVFFTMLLLAKGA